MLSSNQYRIVLTWGETPADLDSHLITPSGEEIYYHNKETTAGDANLDVDNTTSYGPETVTITAPQSGTYRYYVFNYSEKDNGTDTSLTTSHAVVRVYNSSGLLKTYTVPATGAGLYWNVFTLNGSTITDVNAIGTVPPSGSTYSANRASRK